MSKNLCHKCGVELDMGLTECPLCAASDNLADVSNNNDSGKSASGILEMSDRERKRYAWELTGIICASAIIVSLIVDMVIVQGISWALYCVISFVAVWNCLTLFIFAAKRIWVMSTGLLLNLLGMLVLIDVVDGPIEWFVTLGLPIATTLVVLTSIILVLIKKANFKGFNILALILISASILCMVIEIFTDIYVNEQVVIGWSAITASAIIPFSGILMFVHYRMKRGKNLSSYFHI